MVTHPGCADNSDKELEEDDDSRVERLPRSAPVPRMVFAVRQPANQPVTVPLEAQACQLLELLVPGLRLCPRDTAWLRHDGLRSTDGPEPALRSDNVVDEHVSISPDLGAGPLYIFLREYHRVGMAQFQMCQSDVSS